MQHQNIIHTSRNLTTKITSKIESFCHDNSNTADRILLLRCLVAYIEQRRGLHFPKPSSTTLAMPMNKNASQLQIWKQNMWSRLSDFDLVLLADAVDFSFCFSVHHVTPSRIELLMVTGFHKTMGQSGTSGHEIGRLMWTGLTIKLTAFDEQIRNCSLLVSFRQEFAITRAICLTYLPPI